MRSLNRIGIKKHHPRMYVRKTVVKGGGPLSEQYEEITLEEAAEYKANPMVGV